MNDWLNIALALLGTHFLVFQLGGYLATKRFARDLTESLSLREEDEQEAAACIDSGTRGRPEGGGSRVHAKT